jgi:hypothetical protein
MRRSKQQILLRFVRMNVVDAFTKINAQRQHEDSMDVIDSMLFSVSMDIVFSS